MPTCISIPSIPAPTSKDCDLEHLSFWGRKKGITVIGTGDFTHPAWFSEIKENWFPRSRACSACATISKKK